MAYNPASFNPQGTGSAEAVVSNYTNNSSVTAIPQGQACSVDSAGNVEPLDVSNQASWSNFVGYANVRIPTSALGPVIANGRLRNITISYPVGTPLYIGTDGNPTNIAPSDGVNGFVAGDMCIFMGVVVQNELNPSETDIALLTQMIAVLQLISLMIFI